VLQGTLDPRVNDAGWERMRALSLSLGRVVRHGEKQYQLWGVTPRGAICFDGYVLRTFDHVAVAPAT